MLKTAGGNQTKNLPFLKGGFQKLKKKIKELSGDMERVALQRAAQIKACSFLRYDHLTYPVKSNYWYSAFGML